MIITSVMHHISVTVWHMIMIFGTLLSNGNICGCFSLFFFILFFWVVRGVKGQKITQNGKTLSVTVHISGIIHHMLVLYGTLEWNDISWHFFHLFNFDVVRGVKGQKIVWNDKKVCLWHSISPFLWNHTSYDHHL